MASSESDSGKKRKVLCFASLARKRLRTDLAQRRSRSRTGRREGRVVAHAELKITAATAREYFPQSKLLVNPTRAGAIQSVCRKEAAVAIVESRVLDSILLERPDGCEHTAFALSCLRGAATSLSLMSAKKSQAKVEALRDEITRLADSGFLSEKLDEWTPLSAQGGREFWKARVAEERTAKYRVGFLYMAGFALMLIWLAKRAASLRKVAERAETSLREAERRFAAFMDNSPALSFMKDQDGRLVYVNKSFLQILGGTKEDWCGKTDFEVWPNDVAQKIRTDEVELMRLAQQKQFIDIAPDANGETRHWLTVKFPFKGESGGMLVGGTAIDITESETARRALAASEERYRELSGRQQNTLEQLAASEMRWQLALSGAGDALWDWDLATGVVFRSPAWKSMLGYDDEEIGSRREDWEDILHPSDAARAVDLLEAHLRRHTPCYASEYRMRHKDGTWRWILDRGQAMWDVEGRPIRMAGSHADITGRKATEEALAIQAATDSLTGVSNRGEFDRAFAALVNTAIEKGEVLTVCVCDLDRFKQINDAHGHPAGDRVLAGFGSLLRRNVRECDSIWRVGGDEFVLALPDTSKHQARWLIERVRAELEIATFSTDAGKEFQLSCSFGVAQLEDHHGNSSDLFSEADRSLYQAKHMGRNRSWVA